MIEQGAVVLELCREYQRGLRRSSEAQVVTRRHISCFYRFLEVQDITSFTQLTPALLFAYQQHVSHQQKAKGSGLRSPSTIASYMQAVRLVCRILYRHGILPTNPALELPPIKITNQARSVPTVATMQDFLEAIDTSTVVGIRNRALFELIYACGLRASEAAGLRCEDIDWQGQTIRVSGKNSQIRIVPISEVAQAFLAHYIGPRVKTNGPVFRNSRNQGTMKGKRVWQILRAELKDQEKNRDIVCTHAIRHATATHLLEHGAPIRYVQELLGHESLQTTVRYTKHLYETIQGVYRRHHPRGSATAERFGAAYQSMVGAVLLQRRDVKKSVV